MAWFAKNVRLGKALRVSKWRKASFGMWRTAADPSVYGILDLDAGPALAYIEKLRKETGLKITMSHFAGRVLGELLARHPEINCVYRFGRLYPRLGADVFFQVADDEAGRELSGTTIRDADKKSIPQIATELQSSVKAIRVEGDRAFAGMKDKLDLTPGILSGVLLRIVGFIEYSLNIWVPFFGLPRDAFGSVMLTSVGSIGLDTAFAPLVPFSRTPMMVAVGTVRRVAVVREDDRIEPAPMLRMGVTFDHRLIDGKHASHMAKTVQKLFADPERELAQRS